MVRALTGTMLLAGRGTIGLDDFRNIIESRDCTRANFGVPGRGLFLCKVNFWLSQNLFGFIITAEMQTT